jgi:hypothetical protein
MKNELGLGDRMHMCKVVLLKFIEQYILNALQCYFHYHYLGINIKKN